MVSHVEKSRLKLLTAVSSLKRAAGIPDSAWRRDITEEDNYYSLYTSDLESVHILCNLMGQLLIAPHTEKYYSTREDSDPRYFLTMDKLDSDTYEVRFAVLDTEVRQLTERVKKLTQKLIAPDSGMAYRSR